MTHEYSISVLLPTRGRTDALKRSVISLFNRAVNLNSIELMLGFDNDDAVGIDYFEKELQPWLDQKGVNYTAMTFDPIGYGRLNEYVNTLAANSSADWYFFWNDDALMETTGWNRCIEQHTGQFKLLAVHTHQDHPYSIFPIVPAEWMTVLGHLSPHSLTDAWLSQEAYCLDIWERIEVYVTHDRFDLTGNNNDTTFNNRVMHEGDPSNPMDFHHVTWNALRVAECDKLAAYMETRGLDVSWWKNVKLTLQDPWEKLKINDVNNQMKQFQVTV